MRNSTLTLQNIITKYSHNDDVEDNARQSELLAEYLAYKAETEVTFKSSLQRVLPGQVHLRQTVNGLYVTQLRNFTKEHGTIDALFPHLDVSFLQGSHCHPKWAIFDASLDDDTFKLGFTYRAELRHPTSVATGLLVIQTAYPEIIRSYPERFTRYFANRDERMTINIPGRDSDEASRSRLITAFQTKPTHKDGYGSVSFYLDTEWQNKHPNFVIYEPNRVLRSVEVFYEATFNSFVPLNILEKINNFREQFDEIFFVADVPDWQPSAITAHKVAASGPATSLLGTSLRAKVDPLVVGRRDEDFWLLDAFDLTDNEDYIKQEFASRPIK